MGCPGSVVTHRPPSLEGALALDACAHGQVMGKRWCWQAGHRPCTTNVHTAPHAPPVHTAYNAVTNGTARDSPTKSITVNRVSTVSAASPSGPPAPPSSSPVPPLVRRRPALASRRSASEAAAGTVAWHERGEATFCVYMLIVACSCSTLRIEIRCAHHHHRLAPTTPARARPPRRTYTILACPCPCRTHPTRTPRPPHLARRSAAP